jgi:hypothetical protein
MVTKEVLLETLSTTFVALICFTLLVFLFNIDVMVAFGSAIPIAIALIWSINKIIKHP